MPYAVPVPANYLAWRDRVTAFDTTAAWRFVYFTLSGPIERPVRVQGVLAEPTLLSPLRRGADARPAVHGRGRPPRTAIASSSSVTDSGCGNSTATLRCRPHRDRRRRAVHDRRRPAGQASSSSACSTASSTSGARSFLTQPIASTRSISTGASPPDRVAGVRACRARVGIRLAAGRGIPHGVDDGCRRSCPRGGLRISGRFSSRSKSPSRW